MLLANFRPFQCVWRVLATTLTGSLYILRHPVYIAPPLGNLPSSGLCACVRMLSHVRFFATPWSPPGFSVYGISQARILKWVAIYSSRGPSQSRDQIHISCGLCIGRWILYHLSDLEALLLSWSGLIASQTVGP